MHYCLGIAFWRESGKTFITQRKYAREILDTFQMSERKSVSTPLDQNVKLYNSNGSKEADGALYHQLVGSLNYLTTTRPNLSYSVSILIQFLIKPCETHWKAAKQVLRYLKGTFNYVLLYTDVSDVQLAGYSDSDWEGNPNDRKSTSGYAFNIGS